MGTTAWVLDAAGRPKTPASVARDLNMTPKQVEGAIGELAAVGTIERRSDGAIGFPNFAKYQDSVRGRPSMQSAWIKVYDSLWKSESHRDLSPLTFAVLPRLLWLAGRTRFIDMRAAGIVATNTATNTATKTRKNVAELSTRRQKTEDRRRRVNSIDQATPDLTPAKRRGVGVAAVWTHYRTYHPRQPEKLKSKSKDYRDIRARLAEGCTVDRLCRAIDGLHKTPYNIGENESGTKYLRIGLALDSASRVAERIEYLESGPGPGLALPPNQAERIAELAFAAREEEEEEEQQLIGAQHEEIRSA